MIHHIWRHVCFKGAVGRKEYQRVKLFLFDTQKIRQRLDVFVVLVKWILEFRFLSEQALSP